MTAQVTTLNAVQPKLVQTPTPKPTQTVGMTSAEKLVHDVDLVVKRLSGMEFVPSVLMGEYRTCLAAALRMQNALLKVRG
jgi:hypothetical protein